MNVIAWLRTPVATLIVLCAALVAQLPHAADVFRIIVSGTGWPAILHGYAYAIALELAVLLFVVQRRNVESYIFAGVSVLVNLSYYSLHGIDLLTIAALPAWLVSIALPAAIARYSHLLVETPQAQTQLVQNAIDAIERAQVHVDAANALAQRISTEAMDANTALLDNANTTPLPQDGAHVDVVQAQPTSKPRPRKVRKAKGKATTPQQRHAQIVGMGINDAAAVAAQFGVSLRTAQADLEQVRKATTQTNGVHA